MSTETPSTAEPLRSDATPVSQPRCGSCEAEGVRIYREYGSFYRSETDRCNGCIPADHRGWMVPCVLSEDGSPWGYLSVPTDAAERFYALPEKSDAHPSWRRVGGWAD
jgi:hypothetical protein